MMEINKEKIEEALIKKAMGYDFEESVEEFSFDEQNGKLKPCKKRVSTKHMPPDIPAMKTLMTMCDESKNKYALMTEEELLEERAHLLEMLSEEK